MESRSLFSGKGIEFLDRFHLFAGRFYRLEQNLPCLSPDTFWEQSSQTSKEWHISREKTGRVNIYLQEPVIIYKRRKKEEEEKEEEEDEEEDPIVQALQI